MHRATLVLYAAVSILAAALVLVLWRPRGLSIAWPALGGAAACVALRLVTLTDLWRVVERTWNALAALVGLMLLSAVLESSGAFRAAAHRIARAARGHGLRLYFGLCLLTAGTAALLANDGAVLLVTPVVAELVGLLSFSPAAAFAYLFSTGFLCDALSTVLPTSNLTNILAVDTLHIGVGRFVAHMILPSCAILAVGVATLALELRGALPHRFARAALGPPPPFRRRSAVAASAALLALAVGYGFALFMRLPLGLVVLATALLLGVWEHRSLRGSPLRRLPWGVVGFAFGLFVIVTALDRTGAVAGLVFLLDPRDRGRFSAVYAAGGTVALLSALIDNLPALLASLLALVRLGAPAKLPFAVLIGSNVGDKLTPIGSLATLLWLELLRRHGIRCGLGRYLRLAWLPTLACLAAALTVLALIS